MVFRYLILLLTLNQLANGIDEKTSKVLSCMQQSQLRKSMAVGNRTWVVPDQFDPGQDIICSHLSTSDGIRMCACMCETNLKGFSDDDKINWIVPKYRQCGELQSAIDFKIYCYDLATSDGNRMCSCTCSTVKRDLYDIRTITPKTEEVIANDIKRSVVRDRNEKIEKARASLTKSATDSVEYKVGELGRKDLERLALIAVDESDKVRMKGLNKTHEEILIDNKKPDIIVDTSNTDVDQEPDIFQEPLLNEIASLLTTPNVDTTTIALTVSSAPVTTDRGVSVTKTEIGGDLLRTKIPTNGKEDDEGQNMLYGSEVSYDVQSGLQVKYKLNQLNEMDHAFNSKTNEVKVTENGQLVEKLESSEGKFEAFTKNLPVTEKYVPDIGTSTKVLLYDNSSPDGLVIYEPTVTNWPSKPELNSATEPNFFSTTTVADENQINIGHTISFGNEHLTRDAVNTKSTKDTVKYDSLLSTEFVKIDAQEMQTEEVDPMLSTEAITPNSLNELPTDQLTTKKGEFIESISTTEPFRTFEEATTMLYDDLTSLDISTQNWTNEATETTVHATNMFTIENENLSSANYQPDFGFNNTKIATNIEYNSTRLPISDAVVSMESTMIPSEISQDTTETSTSKNIQAPNIILTTRSPLSDESTSFSPEESTTTSNKTYTTDETTTVETEYTALKNSEPLFNTSYSDETLDSGNLESEEILIIDLSPKEISRNIAEYQLPTVENSTFFATTLTTESFKPITQIQTELSASTMIPPTESNLDVAFQELLENNEIVEMNSTHEEQPSNLNLTDSGSVSNATTTENYENKAARDKSIDPILYTETLNNPKSGLNLHLDANEPNRQSYADNIELKDNVLVVYPSGGYINRKAKANSPQGFPKQPNHLPRNKKDNEKVFYVYSQSVVESPKNAEVPSSVSVVMPQGQDKSDQSLEPSEKSTEENNGVSTPLDNGAEVKTHVSAVTINSAPEENGEDSTTETVKNVAVIPRTSSIEKVTTSIAETESSDLSLIQSNQTSSQRRSDSFEIADDAEDESVTIAYSGIVYQTVLAENLTNVSTSALPLSTASVPVIIVTAETIPTSETEPQQNIASISSPIDVLHPTSLTPATETSASSSTPSLIDVLSPNTSTGRLSSIDPALLEKSSSLPYTSNASASATPATMASAEAFTTAPSPTASANVTFSPSITSTASTTFSLKSMIAEVKTIKPMLPEDVKMKRQNQFMEFLKKRSQNPSRSRHVVKEYTRPTTTRAPLVGRRQIFKDASHRRSSFIKTRGKTQPIGNKNTEAINDPQNVTEVTAPKASSITTTSDTPRLTNSTKAKEGIIIRRRPLLRIRTTTVSQDD